LDAAEAPIPVQPTCHYAMGGIPTDLEGRVVAGPEGNVVPGLYAAGECACVSVHGANRLGCNSLLDIVVFGARAGRCMVADGRGLGIPDPSPTAAEQARLRIEDLLEGSGQETAACIRERMQETMMVRCSVFRNRGLLEEARRDLAKLRARYVAVRIEDRNRRCNTDLIEALELGFLLALAETMVAGALAREESRGAHYREDFPERDDRRFLLHTLTRKGSDGPEITYKSVRITRYPPRERTY